MAKKILTLNTGEAIASSTDYEAAPGGFLVTLGYKQMAGKPKPPANFVACIPVLDLPTCGNAGLDSILKATMESFAESLCRKLRTEEQEADSIEFDAADFSLEALIEHAEEKASSLKLSEQIITAWFKQEGEAAVTASYVVATGKTADDAATVKAVANMLVLFYKLAAPVPDIAPELAAILLSRLEVIDAPTSTTQAIRRKLEQRVEMGKKAQSLLSGI